MIAQEEQLLYGLKSELLGIMYECRPESVLHDDMNILAETLCKHLGAERIRFLLRLSAFETEEIAVLLKPPEIFSFIDDWDEMKHRLREDGRGVFVRIGEGAFPPYKTGILLRNGTRDPIGCILLDRISLAECPSAEWWEQFSLTVSQFLLKLFSFKSVCVKEIWNEKLLRVTMKIHSSMDIGEVLQEMVEFLKELYPAFSYHLLLSNDNDCGHLPVQLLNYNDLEALSMKAYVTGQVCMEEGKDGNTLYFPLKGKQGVYGILQIGNVRMERIPKTMVEFISILANTAGNAMENAHLYQQSNQLVRELKLVTKVSHQLNSRLSLDDRTHYMISQLKSSLRAEEAAFVLLKGKNPHVLQGSTPFFFGEESAFYLRFLQNHFSSNREPLFIGDFSEHQKDRRHRFLSLMAVPMEQEDEIWGFAVALHHEPYFFSFKTFKLFQTLTQHSSLAIANSLLREELEWLVITDYSTKLYNRNYLDQVLEKSMAEDLEGTFILIDIDNFKFVNDTYGHHVGDRVLIQLAGIIKDNLTDREISARWGGEELAIYMPGRSLRDGVLLAERIAKLAETHTDPKVTISCGVAYWNRKMKDDPLKLFRRADEALYDAKRKGKNRVIAYSC